MADFYTTVGKTKVVDRVDNTQSGGNTDYLTAGTGAGAAGLASTVLSTEVSEARVATTKSQPAADTNQWLAVQTYTGTKTITNAGVFDASTVGSLMLISDGLSILVASGDSIQFTFTLQQT
jgi:hypothetical protein